MGTAGRSPALSGNWTRLKRFWPQPSGKGQAQTGFTDPLPMANERRLTPEAIASRHSSNGGFSRDPFGRPSGTPAPWPPPVRLWSVPVSMTAQIPLLPFEHTSGACPPDSIPGCRSPVTGKPVRHHAYRTLPQCSEGDTPAARFVEVFHCRQFHEDAPLATGLQLRTQVLIVRAHPGVNDSLHDYPLFWANSEAGK